MSPAVTPSDSSDSSSSLTSPSTSHHTAIAAISGGVVGAVVALIIGIAFWRIMRMRRARRDQEFPVRIRHTREVDLLEKGIGYTLGYEGVRITFNASLVEPPILITLI